MASAEGRLLTSGTSTRLGPAETSTVTSDVLRGSTLLPAGGSCWMTKPAGAWLLGLAATRMRSFWPAKRFSASPSLCPTTSGISIDGGGLTVPSEGGPAETTTVTSDVLRGSTLLPTGGSCWMTKPAGAWLLGLAPTRMRSFWPAKRFSASPSLCPTTSGISIDGGGLTVPTEGGPAETTTVTSDVLRGSTLLPAGGSCWMTKPAGAWLLGLAPTRMRSFWPAKRFSASPSLCPTTSGISIDGGGLTLPTEGGPAETSTVTSDVLRGSTLLPAGGSCRMTKPAGAWLLGLAPTRMPSLSRAKRFSASPSLCPTTSGISIDGGGLTLPTEGGPAETSTVTSDVLRGSTLLPAGGSCRMTKPAGAWLLGLAPTRMPSLSRAKRFSASPSLCPTTSGTSTSGAAMYLGATGLALDGSSCARLGREHHKAAVRHKARTP